MLSRFLPRQEKFFALFDELAGQIVDGAHEARALLGDLSQSDVGAQRLKAIEQRGDKIATRTVALLRTAFVTPLDRDDMHRLIYEMDNVLDIIEKAGQRVLIYDIRALPAEALQLAEVCLQAVTHLRAAIEGLSDPKKPEPILRACVEISQLADQAGQLLRLGMSRLFREETDAQNLIKAKEIYELLAKATFRCDTVSEIIDGIILDL